MAKKTASIDTSSISYDWEKEEKLREKMFGTYVQVPDEFVQIMSVDLAYFLSFLINWSRTKGRLTENNGWFYCSTKTIEEKIRWNDQKQWKMLRMIRKQEILQIEMKGSPQRRRWIRIDYSRLCQMISEQ